MKLKVALASALLTASLCSAWQVQAAQAVSLDWLKVVAFAAHQTEYSGVFVYQYGGQVDTSRITHVIGHDTEFEKLERLDGPKREIIRHHGQVWVVMNEQMVQVDSQHARQKFPALLPEQLLTVAENYEILSVGTERVAGYNAQLIQFKPKDKQRFTQRIWVHTDSGLLLKAAVIDDENRVVEQYAFTQLQIGGDIDRSWIDNVSQSLPKEHGHQTANNKVASVVSSGWVAEMVPAGFRKVTEIERPMRGKAFSVTQMVFSDGLSAISIFIEPSEQAAKMPRHVAGRGAVNMSRRVTEKYLITVVGEVPPQVVQQIANSVRFVGVN